MLNYDVRLNGVRLAKGILLPQTRVAGVGQRVGCFALVTVLRNTMDDLHLDGVHLVREGGLAEGIQTQVDAL